jgi:hypothetical protein
MSIVVNSLMVRCTIRTLRPEMINIAKATWTAATAAIALALSSRSAVAR